MAKKPQKKPKKKKKPENGEKSFIGKVSKYSKDRLHVEVPIDKRKVWKPGNYAKVDPIE